ncbi:WRKY domain-containing protein [Dioscorea alata]|uniref:WRKY domain-containing protein n=1 Tax=Dioscorea alata TaxID=55571 RepID=A0ACB7TUN5_DIOAL|nr:WRKY domain-containing protein [Dioscorea alata]
MDDNGTATTYEVEEPGSSDGPSPKKRRTAEKRVVSVPIGDGDGPRNKAGGEAAPPTDSWAWRKYGQKPIKGSPYPRGYYRCSSSKGCPARKQVERSRVDPTMLVVTYSSDHNHPWPLPKNQHAGAAVTSRASPKSKAAAVEEADPGPIQPDPEERFTDLIADDMLGGVEFGGVWFSDVGSPSPSASPTEGSDDTMLYGSIAGCSAGILFLDDSEEKVEREWEKEEEEDSLFAGLGELPECSMVFRRGFQAAATATVTAAASSGC